MKKMFRKVAYEVTNWIALGLLKVAGWFYDYEDWITQYVARWDQIRKTPRLVRVWRDTRNPAKRKAKVRLLMRANVEPGSMETRNWR